MAAAFGGVAEEGLSQAAYCRQQGLTQNDFSWWKREIAGRAVATGQRFVPVQIAAPPRTVSYAFELELRGARMLRFDGCVDPAALNAVVRVLEAEAAPC